MVWLIVGLPALSIVMGTIYAVIAFRVFDGVVVDDYSKRGRAINRVLARDRTAGEAGLEASVGLDPRTGSLEMRLDAAVAEALPASVRLQFLHATRAGVDRATEMRRGDDGRYRGEIAALAPGKYHLQLETESWRLVGQLLSPGQSACELAPAL
jgi:hypothetical protein